MASQVVSVSPSRARAGNTGQSCRCRVSVWITAKRAWFHVRLRPECDGHSCPDPKAGRTLPVHTAQISTALHPGHVGASAPQLDRRRGEAHVDPCPRSGVPHVARPRSHESQTPTTSPIWSGGHVVVRRSARRGHVSTPICGLLLSWATPCSRHPGSRPKSIAQKGATPLDVRDGRCSRVSVSRGPDRRSPRWIWSLRIDNRVAQLCGAGTPPKIPTSRGADRAAAVAVGSRARR